MTTLTEIQSAAGALSLEQKQVLYRFLEGQLEKPPGQLTMRLSVLDIEPVHLGPVLQPFAAMDDVHDEMLGVRG